MTALIKRLALNEKGRDFIVGDVHGHFDRLEDLLGQVSFDPKADRLICVGDLIDRGPDSDCVLAWLDRPYLHSVLGNHELMAMMAATGEDREGLHAMNGGAWMAVMEEATQLEYAQAFATLPLAIELQTKAGLVGVVHADIPPGMTWQQVAELLDAGDRGVANVLLWGRDRITAAARGMPWPSVPGIDRVFVGHTPLKDPSIVGNVFFIDSGACFGGPMVLVDPALGEIVATQGSPWKSETSSHAA